MRVRARAGNGEPAFQLYYGPTLVASGPIMTNVNGKHLNLMFPLLPEDWVNFAEQVVPELQRRGLVPTEYASGTLRDRFGLFHHLEFYEPQELQEIVSRSAAKLTFTLPPDAAGMLQPLPELSFTVMFTPLSRRSLIMSG